MPKPTVLSPKARSLFAQRKSAEAIQLLRKAYELDKNNSLARAILANALVEHAHSVVEIDWWEAETLAKQALDLNPAHPTAKTIRSLVLDRKKTSSVEDWVSRARKLQSSGDLFAALAWVAEGLAVHPDDPKLIQIQDEIQRDQGARRRQSRRRDLQDLRRMESEIDGAADVAAKQVLAERIQAVAAKYWTDGEILSVANGLLHRLGLVPQESSTSSPHSKGATVIFHVPRPSASKAPRAATSQVPPSPVADLETFRPSPLFRAEPRSSAPHCAAGQSPNHSARAAAPAATSRHHSRRRAFRTGGQSHIPIPAKTAHEVELHNADPHLRRRDNPVRSDLLLRAKTSRSASSEDPISRSRPSQRPPSRPRTSPRRGTNNSRTSSACFARFFRHPAGKVTLDDQPPAESGHNVGTLLVVAGQDDARVFLNGKLQPQLTQAGQLRLPNLELKDYVVQVSKNGFQDPPQQKIRIRKGEQARLTFNLQPQPRLASLTIQGGAPGTTVLVDQTLVGTIQPDGTLSVSTVNPGDHTVELRKERFKPRQFKEHFVGGGTISLAAADAALEAGPGELRITFAPADAKVAIVKGELLKIVSSGVPLNLAPGTYTLTARTAERFTRSSTLEVIAGQSRTLDLSLAPSGMSKWDDPGAWKHERDSFIRKGGDFVLYGVVPASGTFVFSAMPTKGHLLQWVLNYTDPKNYVLFQMDDNNFYRAIIRNGEKTDEIKVPDKGDKKSFRTLQIRVSPRELVHQIKHGDSWTVLDRWTQPGANLSLGKFGFYIPGNDQVALSSFAHYTDLNIR